MNSIGYFIGIALGVVLLAVLLVHRARTAFRGGLMNKGDKSIVGVRMFDLHLGLVAAKRTPDGGVEAPKPLIYGTAFPILPGLFVTAGHSARDAKSDGLLGLIRLGSNREVVISPVTRCEVFDAVDLALIECPSLANLVPFRLEFDQVLGPLDSAYAVGFPHAMDVEWVTIVPRGFRGYVVTRRELYQMPGQPPGYEVSFPAPQGLSGAPLVSHIHGDHRCYGYIIQQSTVGSGEDKAVLAVAVDIGVLLSLKTELLSAEVLSKAFGRKPVQPRAPSPKQLPGGQKPIVFNPDDWPEE